MKTGYIPEPVDTSDVEVNEEVMRLAEVLAKNTHDVWAKGRIAEGWRYGETLDPEKKERPDLVAYEDLPESEKDYDRNTSLETLKVLIKLGFKISRQ